MISNYSQFFMAVNPPFRVVETFEPAPGSVPSLTWANPFPGNGTIPPSPEINAVSADRRNPYHQQWNVTLETEVLPNTGVRASYVGNRGTHLERNCNLNDPAPAREESGSAGRGRYGPPKSNAAYGTAEAPLIQTNGDPRTDLLYTSNFAFLGLHEAAAATGEATYRDAAERLTDYVVRIQARSARFPEFDGAWFRAFDYGRWDYWASNADHGWGAWSVETGWTQAWVATVLGLRELKTSVWELTSNSQVAKHAAVLIPSMVEVP